MDRLPRERNAMNHLLTITAIIETGSGLASLVVTASVVRLLLAGSLETAAAITLGRVGGAGLLALGIACRLARGDAQSRAARGLVAAMVLYNFGVAAILGAAGIGRSRSASLCGRPLCCTRR
jgi:hypothetical protein